MLSISADFEKLKKDLAAIGDLDALALNKKIGEALVSSTKERFEDEKSPSGKAWKKSYRAASSGGQTLSDSGTLKNSIGYHATANSVEVGTNIKYAKVHQEGATIKPKTKKFLAFRLGGGWVRKKKIKIPKREFLGFSKEDIEEIEDTIMDHIDKLRGK